MKYRILINGRNNLLVSDFFQHTEAYFDTLSTSGCWQDILGHFKVFDPQAFICFVEPDYEKTVNQIKNLKTSGYYNNAAIVLIGDAATCDVLEQKERFTANLIVRRPVTPDNLTLKITHYFEELAAAKARAQARQNVQNDAGAKETAVSNEPEAAANNEKKHILIVDDDRTVLKMLKSALGDRYEITTMINGVMVDKLLETKKVDLIVLDYEMPIETGADIFRRLKKNPKAANIPVCFLTGVSDQEKILEVMSLRPHGYLLKPIDMDMLSSTIKNLIG